MGIRDSAPNRSRKIRQRDKSTCQYCGTFIIDDSKLHFDHIIPKCKGGSNEDKNIFVSCSKCNMSKGPLDVEEFREKIINKINFFIEEINYYTDKKIEEIDDYKFYFERDK